MISPRPSSASSRASGTCSSPTFPDATSRGPARSTFRPCSRSSTASATGAGAAPSICRRKGPRTAWRGRRITCKLDAMNVAVTGIDFLRQAEVAGRLRSLLPADAVLHAEEDTRSYECDGLSAYRQLPMVVALPSSEDQVREVLRACHELKVPVTARGSGTGLSGGALPRGDGVLLSLARMRRILAVDAYARTARVQPGVTNLAISEAASPFGLF